METQPKALYRRYRPRRFGEVAGQAAVVEPLRLAVKHGRIGHAYLFAGPRGTGKTTVARIFAKAVDCPKAPALDGEPCGQCPSCEAVDRGSHLDVIEIDAASNRGIDDVRDLRERLAHLPAMAPRKVSIVDEVHMLTTEAFNALLKTLEEPPPHALFLLATTEPHKLPVTVLSRCQRFYFQRLSVPVIRDRLAQVLDAEGIAWEGAALERLAEAADGALRDALSLADQAVGMLGENARLTTPAVDTMLGVLDEQALTEVLSALAHRDLAQTAARLSEWYQRGGDPRQLVRDLARWLRDVVVYRQAGEEAVPTHRRSKVAALSAQLAANLEPERWFAALDALAEAESRLRGSFPADLVVELAVFKVGEALATRSDPSPLPAPAPSAANRPAPAVGEPVAMGSGMREALLERLRRRRVTTWALVRQAEMEGPQEGSAGEGEWITLRFAYPAHRDLFAQPENRAAFDAVLREVYGREIEVRIAVAQAPAEGGTPADWPQRVRNFFGGDVEYQGLE